MILNLVCKFFILISRLLKILKYLKNPNLFWKEAENNFKESNQQDKEDNQPKLVRDKDNGKNFFLI